MRTKVFVLLQALIVVNSFISPANRFAVLTRSKRHGIAEWRDLVYDGPLDPTVKASTTSLPRAITILPFPFDEVLIQGETKQLRLYEDRFLHLFDEAVQHGVVGMGLLAQSGLIQTIPICEIEAYNRMDEFGIFVTIRAVGRAQLLTLTQQEPYIKAVCVELADELPTNLDMGNLLASTIEQALVAVSSMEYRLKTVEATVKGKNLDNINDNDNAIQRRINIAKLESQFRQDEDGKGVVDDTNEALDDDVDDDSELDRRGLFQQAFQIAMETDSQGYLSSAITDERSPKELTALSWAAFCTDDTMDLEMATFRIQAMDETKLVERLKLASTMFKRKKSGLEAKLKNVELKRDDDDL